MNDGRIMDVEIKADAVGDLVDQTMSTVRLLNLPEELLCHVLEDLDVLTLDACASVCRLFRRLCSANSDVRRNAFISQFARTFTELARLPVPSLFRQGESSTSAKPPGSEDLLSHVDPSWVSDLRSGKKSVSTPVYYPHYATDFTSSFTD
jgi:hypothetical protein